MKQDQQLKQKTTGRTIFIVAASSIFLIAVAMIFVLNVGNVRKMFAGTSKRTVTTIKDGNWNDNTIWNTGSAPNNYSSDSIVILNKVNFNTSFTVGDKSKTGITIGSTGSLIGSNTLTLEKSASLTNIGIINVSTLSVNSGPTNQIINSGTMTLSSSLSLWSSVTSLNNSGSMTIGGATTISGPFVNSGTFKVTGDFTLATTTLISNSGSITTTGSAVFNGGSLNDSKSSSSFSVGGNMTLNNNAIIVNSGKINISTSNSNGTLTINSGNITNGSSYVPANGPVFTLNGSLTMSGNGNTLFNNGLFTVTESILSYSGSIITDNDSMVIGTSFQSQSKITVNKMAYLGVGTDFTNSGNLDIESGYVAVSGNFTDDWGSSFTGTKGGISIAKIFTNHITISGSVDVCDKTPNSSGDLNGTMAPTVTTCTFVPPKNGPSALPVTLTKFTASKDGNTVSLIWTTASEINNERFDIERSGNGTDFEVIGTVKGNGTKQSFTNYSYTDQSPLQGIGYYRLQQFDFNGKSAYSPIAVVHFDGSPAEPLDVSVFPNPAAAGSALHVEMTIPVSEILHVELINMKGQSIYHNEAEAEAGKIQRDINLPGNLSGMCVLNVTYRGQTTSKKIMIR